MDNIVQGTNLAIAERVTRALHPPEYKGFYEWVNSKPQGGHIEVFCSDWNKDHWAFYAYIGVDSYREDLKGINSLIEHLNWRDGDVYIELIDHSDGTRNSHLKQLYDKIYDNDRSHGEVLNPDIWEKHLTPFLEEQK